MAMVHQGKSIAQWEKEFKGEFTGSQLATMARCGTDLQRLLLTVNGHCTLDEAEGEESSTEEKAEVLPTRWVFLKITLKK